MSNRAFQLEALEGRQLMSAAPAPADPPAMTAEIVDGVLIVHGTAGRDGICVGIEGDGNHVFVQNGPSYMDFEKAGLKGIYLDGGAGDDELIIDNWHGALDVPVTMVGGAGDDVLNAQSGRGRADEWTLTPTDYSHMRTTMLGGSGDDWLYGGPGREHYDGGSGHDRYAGYGPGSHIDAWDTFANSSGAISHDGTTPGGERPNGPSDGTFGAHAPTRPDPSDTSLFPDAKLHPWD